MADYNGAPPPAQYNVPPPNDYTAPPPGGPPPPSHGIALPPDPQHEAGPAPGPPPKVSLIQKLLRTFKRKKQPPLACHISIDHDENHEHSAACFLDVQPLALAELFQSQGCPACPPAIPSILDATNHPNIQHLTYNVTFFDQTGWKDTFASPRWDQRQKNYVKHWGRKALFTPMVVVNGVADGGAGGGSKSEIDGVVHRAREAQGGMGWHIILDSNDTHVRLDTDRQQSEMFEVLVITYLEKTETVKVVSSNLPSVMDPLYDAWIVGWTDD
jgi:hypothetical protein